MGNQPWPARRVLPQCAVLARSKPCGLMGLGAHGSAGPGPWPPGHTAPGGPLPQSEGPARPLHRLLQQRPPPQPRPTLLRCAALPIPKTYNSMSRGLM